MTEARSRTEAFRAYHRVWIKKWRAANPERARAISRRYYARHRDKVLAKARRTATARHLRRTYGLTIAAFKAMGRRQQGKCRICKAQPKRLHVDHDHKTKRIRGLLCGSCNRALGLFKDSTKSLSRAIKYIETRS